MKEFKLEGRFTVDGATVDAVRMYCTPSSKFTWVDRSTRLRLHTWRGVPGKHGDVLLPECAGPYACEIGRKVGCYDGAQRWRITVRPWRWIADRTPCADPWILPGSLSVTEEHEGNASVVVLLARWQPAKVWAQAFPQLRYEVAPGPRIGVLLRHWKDYYRFLPEDEVRQTGHMFDSSPEVQQCTDINLLNRWASNALYQLSVNLGWRKLTRREKVKFGLADDAPSWHRRDGLTMRLCISGEGSPTGCGQYTERAAAGCGICPECHGLRRSCGCA